MNTAAQAFEADDGEPAPRTATASMAAAYEAILAAHRQPARRRLTIRLTSREIAALAHVAAGRSLSAALQDVVAAYIRRGRSPRAREKSISKATFFLTPSLLAEVQQLARDTGTTKAEVIHAALRDALHGQGSHADG